MPTSVPHRPTSADHNEYYANYIGRVPSGDLVEIMTAQIAELRALLGPVDDANSRRAYAPGKWTVREVVGHLVDTERVFSYRATAFSRGDTQPLPSFDQAAWNVYGNYDSRTLADLLDEWEDTRRSSLALVRSMPAEALPHRGIASGFEFTALACLCILPGHVNYHVERLREDYGIGAT